MKVTLRQLSFLLSLTAFSMLFYTCTLSKKAAAVNHPPTPAYMPPGESMRSANHKDSLELQDTINMYGSKLAYMSPPDRKKILQGRTIFIQICSGCHGPQGKGLGSMGGMGAPPFVGSKRVSGPSSTLIKILLDGLIGPIDGKKYPDYMPPLGAGNDDEWVASILSYIRYEFGNIDAPMVAVEEVKKIRAVTAGRSSTWTLSELEKTAGKQ